MFHPAVQVFGRNANAAARAAAMRRSQCAACVWRAACSMMTISSPKQCSVNWRGNRKCDMFVSKSMHKDDNGTPGKETEDGHTWHDHQFGCVEDLVGCHVLPDLVAKIFSVEAFDTVCEVPKTLSQKYPDACNVQRVISIRNRFTHDVTFFNPARAKKPQNFLVQSSSPIDPTGGGGPGLCDFCEPEKFTAKDSFGCVESSYARSGSNLFKYVGPYQGIIVFKRHDPLTITLKEFADTLMVSQVWFESAMKEHRRVSGCVHDDLSPFWIWNCLHRSGASQYHGHAQVMLSSTPFPTIQRVKEAQAYYKSLNPNRVYEDDIFKAHESIGLGMQVSWQEMLSEGTERREYGEMRYGNGGTTNYTNRVYTNICPWKEAEIIIQGESLTCPGFIGLLYVAVQTFVHELGIQSFNVGIHSISVGSDQEREDKSQESKEQNKNLVTARIIGRGKLTSLASDFGGLEVFAGASIGNTDPWDVFRAFKKKLVEFESLGNFELLSNQFTTNNIYIH